MAHVELALPPDILDTTIESLSGTMPVLITVPHDGTLKELHGQSLPRVIDKPRDFAVAYTARDIYTYTDTCHGQTPTILLQRVHRQHCPRPVIAHFAAATAAKARQIHDQFGRLLHIDLHGFTRDMQDPTTGEIYVRDVILGTDHRRTVRGDEDQWMGDLMTTQYGTIFTRGVHVPTEREHPWEAYGATGRGDGEVDRLVHITSRLDLPRTSSIQFELARRFREPDAGELGRGAAHALAEICIAYAR